MRRKLDIAQLRRIVAIREMQGLVAEAEAARAAGALCEQEARLGQAEAKCDSARKYWEALHADDVLPLDIAALWAQAVRHENENVQKAAVSVRSAVAVREDRLKDFYAVEQRKQLAEDVLDAARRDNARAQDEAALQNATDHHLQKRWAP